MKTKVVFWYLIFLVFLGCSEVMADTVRVPIIYDTKRVYMAIEIFAENSELAKENIDNSIYGEVLNNLIFSVKNGEPEENILSFYTDLDDSRVSMRASLSEDRGRALSLFSDVNKFQILDVIRWGRYTSLVVNYEFQSGETVIWRNDLICAEDKCQLSIVIPDDMRNQIFEIAYFHYISKEKAQLTGVEPSNSLEIFPSHRQYKLKDKDSGIPLRLKFQIKKVKEENQCLYCDQKGNSLLQTMLAKALGKLKELRKDTDLRALEEYVATYDSGFSLNSSVPAVRWYYDDRPTLVDVPFTRYINELLDAESISILGYMESENFVYLFLNKNLGWTNLDNRGEKNSKDRIAAFETLILKKSNKSLLPWFAPVGDFTENIVNSVPFIHAVKSVLFENES